YCRWCPVCYWLLVLLGPKQRLLPQWLTGIIAVSGFLLLTFIAFVVKKVWCEKSSRSVRVHLYQKHESERRRITRVCVSFRRRDDHGEYENVKSKGHKDKATAM
uniref:Uncharacterized protein n=1 Tax=Oryzias latipes TaxID=8090 RepID=A0A3P9K7H6_ORYLA